MDAVAQLFTILVIFLVVIVLTYFVTKRIAGYQKTKSFGSNIEVIETCRISGNSVVMIVRIGDKYVSVAVCKDSVTKLMELSEDDIADINTMQKESGSFGDMMKAVTDKLKEKKS